MKKQYRLKDGVDFEELEKYGYSPCYGSLYGFFSKTVENTSKSLKAVVVHVQIEKEENFVYLIHMHGNARDSLYFFGKNELPYIQDLLDAGLVEEMEA